MGPIAPNEDNRRMVHVSQPNTTRQGLWIGPHVFHMKFDTIEVRVNTNRIYHRRLYTLHFFAFRLGRSELSSSSSGFLFAMCPCMRLQFSSSSILQILRDVLQPRPQGLLLDDFQNGGLSGEDPGKGWITWYKNWRF